MQSIFSPVWVKPFCEIFQGQVNAEFIASCLIERIWRYCRNTQVALTWFNEKYLEHFIMRFVNACFLLQQQKKNHQQQQKK